MKIQSIDDLIEVIKTTPGITKDEVNTLVRLTMNSHVMNLHGQSIDEHKAEVISYVTKYGNAEIRPPIVNFW